MTSLAAELKARALDEGAELAGIAAPESPPESSHYKAWLEAGRQGSMQYMERDAERRGDLRLWYPEARSVLLCAFSYASNEPEAPRPGLGRVARYARVADYHPELKRRLGNVLAWLKRRRSQADGRIFTDTSPILERLYARYAGLGWIGKNTMLISPRLGSYTLLAGLALNLELPPDAPQADHCGSCRRCLEACPTDAFPSERVLDASRCIAYLTIERRGAIPEPLRPAVGDWAFGCDICQEVCPWNRFARPGPALGAPGESALELEPLLALDQAAFKARFQDSCLSRAKRQGLARNAALALGNGGEARHRPALQRAAVDSDPIVAEQASWSLSRLEAVRSRGG